MASRFRNGQRQGGVRSSYQNILFLYPERKEEKRHKFAGSSFFMGWYFLKNNDLYVWSYAKMKEVFGIL